MNRYELSYTIFGEHALLVEWPLKIDTAILKAVLSFKSAVESHFSNMNIQVTSAYNSLLVNDLSGSLNIEFLKQDIKALYVSNGSNELKDNRLWKIPVCYHAEFGLDLELIATQNKLSVNEIIKLHTCAIYTVYLIGFLPGFLYLGGLDKRLYIARKSTPRLQVPKGAVAIGGEQTGVYPTASPGGWNIIGNSPINFFDIKQEKPCFAKAGDAIQFYSISLERYRDIRVLVDANVYQLESEVIRD